MRGVSSTIIAIVWILAVIGLVLVASTSMVGKGDAGNFAFLKRQIVWVALAVAAMCVIMRIDYHLMARTSPWILAGTVLLLVAVLIPGIGKETHGARRWIRFLGFGVQPSEMAKFAMVLFVSWLLACDAWRVRTFTRGLLPVLLVAGLVGGLIVVEPDLGTALLIVVVAVLLAVLAGVRMRHLAPVVVPAGALFACLVWTMRRDRLLAFVNPWRYYDGAGHQLCQALVALGSGGVTGLGLGQSRQKLGYLPEAVHDFIFAILGEEVGIIGTGLVVLLFVAFVWYGMRVASRSRDVLGFLLASGVTSVIGLQALVNIAVVTGSIPTKGISLPFVSFGGSSLFFLMCSVGLLLNVARQTEAATAAAAQSPPDVVLEGVPADA